MANIREEQPAIKVGDTVRFEGYKFDEDGWSTDKWMKVTGKLIEIEPKCNETSFPRYHVKRNGKMYWYSGGNIVLIKSKIS